MKKLTYKGKDVKVVKGEYDCFDCIFQNCESKKTQKGSERFEKANDLKCCVKANHIYIYT